ncbi:MAG: PepSY-associated TM helix domain-containing protein, partial [Hyphomonas sp.]
DPQAEIIGLYAQIHPAAAIDVVARTNSKLPHHVYVHPGTAEILGEGSWAGVQRFLRNTHRHLMLPVTYGVTIVSLAAMLLLVSLVTSFAVYKNWWRGFFRWPRGRTLRAVIGDAHRFIGLWSIWFIALFIVTGLWYLVEVWGGNAPISPRPEIAAIDSLPEAAAMAAALDAGLADIQRDYPGYRVESVSWPSPKFPAFMVHGQSGRAILVRPRVDAFWIDARTGETIGAIDPRALSAHQRISEGADPLHFGTFGGYWTKAIWFLFGAALTAMAVTGVVIYALRIGRGQGAGAPAGGAGRRAWRGMGRARWAALALCLLPLVLAPFVL